jgi:hypothetical protein
VVVPGVDPELAALIHALLARDPAARPASASDLVERFADIAARLRVERNEADGAPPAGIAAATPIAATPADAAPTIPLPNSEMLPAEPWPPPAKVPRPPRRRP